MTIRTLEADEKLYTEAYFKPAEREHWGPTLVSEKTMLQISNAEFERMTADQLRQLIREQFIDRSGYVVVRHPDGSYDLDQPSDNEHTRYYKGRCDIDEAADGSFEIITAVAYVPAGNGNYVKVEA